MYSLDSAKKTDIQFIIKTKLLSKYPIVILRVYPTEADAAKLLVSTLSSSPSKVGMVR